MLRDPKSQGLCHQSPFPCLQITSSTFLVQLCNFSVCQPKTPDLVKRPRCRRCGIGALVKWQSGSQALRSIALPSCTSAAQVIPPGATPQLHGGCSRAIRGIITHNTARAQVLRNSFPGSVFCATHCTKSGVQ